MKKSINLIVNILLIVGGINLGLIGAAHFDLIGKILGHKVAIIRVLYVLIGLSALAKIALLTAFTQKK